jgi:thioredoxin 1
MPTTSLTREDFESTVLGDGIVLVDLWAGWCRPCMAFTPIFEAVAEEHLDISFTKIDTEAEQELALEAGIMSIPALQAFRDGVLLFQEAGALPRAGLEDLIEQIRALDMEQLRAEFPIALDPVSSSNGSLVSEAASQRSAPPPSSSRRCHAAASAGAGGRPWP